MAELTGKVISELPEATTIQGSDLLAISQNAASKKITVENLLDRAGKPAVVFLLGSGSSGITSFGRGVYDPNTNTVRITVAARSTSDITTSMVLATIPAGYRPTSNISIYGAFSTGGGMAAYYGTANANGNITQSLGNTIREAFMYGEYSL